MLARLSLLLLCLGLALPASAQEPLELKVMTFNVWVGGDQVSMTKTLEAIRESGAEVVLLQEPMGNTEAIAELLGWPYANRRQHMIAQYPIFDASDAAAGGGDFAYVELRPGRFVAIANVHLDWTDYGPYKARDGATAEEILAVEQELRLSGIQPYIAALEPVAAGGMPVILGGDFNSPSHLDWTAAAVGTKPHIRFPLVWPASAAMGEAGYQDSWRAIHPDPVASPGVTWSTGYPAPYQWEGETEDRIDLIFARNAEILDSQLIGEAGAADVGIVVDPWASDHHAVVSSFRVVPQPGPALLSLARRGVEQGETLAARWNATGSVDGRLEDGKLQVRAAAGGAPLVAMPTNDTTDRFSRLELATAGLAPGAYLVVLLDGAGAELAQAPFWVLQRGSWPALTTDKAAYAPGETITATLSAAPGNRYDWIAVYAAGEPDALNYLGSAYTAAQVDGAVALDLAATWGEPLAAGQYELRLLRDDSYTAIAVSPPFAVGE